MNDKEKEEEFEKDPVVKKYFKRIFTVLREDIRDKLIKMDLPENIKKKLIQELAFLPEEKQEEFLEEVYEKIKMEK